MKIKKSGGARSGAGRPKKLDKKTGITIQLLQSRVDALGGKALVRQYAVDYLNIL
jgi:hypothetical protein